MSHSVLLGSLALAECLDRRKHIRSHIRMVMERLEEVLAELKDVASQLREVMAQIDKLTDDIDLDSEEDTEDDKVTLDCSSSSSERALGDFSKDTFSESHSLGHLMHNSHLDTPKRQVSGLYRRSCGDIPTLNRPVWVSYSPKPFWLSGRGKKIRYCDNASYHALCCNDDDLDKDHSGRRSRFLSSDSVFSSSSLQPSRVDVLTPTSACKYHQSSRLNKKAVQSCSTQTVSDKSTQTTLSYSPARQRSSSEHKH